MADLFPSLKTRGDDITAVPRGGAHALNEQLPVLFRTGAQGACLTEPRVRPQALEESGVQNSESAEEKSSNSAPVPAPTAGESPAS